MKRLIKPTFIFLLLALTASLAISTAMAQSKGTGYNLLWWTVDGGGATSNTGSGYSLGGTVGQPDANVWAGDGYTLTGGVWGGAAAEHRVFLPLVLKEE